jgi:hypothetical protein
MIHWKPVEHEMPDSDETVLIYSRQADEPVWLGYHDGERWRTTDGDVVPDGVTHWAALPAGPFGTTEIIHPKQ